ncbi:MAG: hypothetical protein J5658_03785 [Prevotella sp.]|nr:hypothetical protein [Prevotella sp.]
MSDERIKISQLPLVGSYVNLYTIGTDNSLNSVKVPLYILSQIGDLSALTTSDKSSIVAAINEAVSEIGQGGGGAGFSQVVVLLEDNTPGTPTAEASISNDTLTLTFHHLKGEKGDSADDLDNLVYIGIDEGPLSIPIPPYEETTNKVTEIDENSTDTQYPSAKCVYDALQEAGGGAGTLDTTATTAQTTNASEALSGNVKLHKVAKTGTLADLIEDTTHRVVTDTEKSTWNGKYSKPSTGIPASDLESGVIPTVPTISTDISTDATSDTKTASPKAVKTYVDNICGNIETLLAAI